MWRFLKKLEIELPYDPAIPLLGIHTEETRIERETCIPMFIAAQLTIVRTWKQPRCPSADERMRKLWYIYTMEFYSAIKKNAFESILMRWMKLEPIILFRISSVQSLSRVRLFATPGLPVHHQLPEFTQTHVHRVGDAIQPSHPGSSPSPSAPNPFQHQSLLQ